MSQKYVAKYVRTSIVKELLIEGETKIRVAGEAKEKSGRIFGSSRS